MKEILCAVMIALSTSLHTGSFDLIAHRGLPSEAPENTIESFQLAIDNGANYTKFDTRMTEDGVPVIMHNEMVDETTNGTGYLRNMTYSEVEKLDAGSWFDVSYKGSKVPSLVEVMQLAKDHDLKVIVDIKEISRIEDVKTIARIIKNYDYPEHIIMQTYDDSIFDAIHTVLPDATLCYVARDESTFKRALNRLKNGGIVSVYYKELLRSDELLEQAKKQGTQIIAYTVNNVETIRKLRELGINGVFTDQYNEMKKDLEMLN
jgi:glycerophosphoryl diester phosphodiesterase